jgi:argininosuccinate lyase
MKSFHFQKNLSTSAQQFLTSIHFDRRLYQEDIEGSIAHAKMLARQGIIGQREAELIIGGLKEIQEEIEQGEFPFKNELEDIHINIESRLGEKIGEIAGKLHTARSRNDQIALDMRLFARKAIKEAITKIKELQLVLVGAAEAHQDVVSPGYTHLQPAQPILLAHHFLAYFEMLQRDAGRFKDCLKRTEVMPLGSGALAGVPYPVDRYFLAEELGFPQISQNSLDAVSDRDFIIEYQQAASLTMMHLSRLAEELILWSSAEFAFITIDKAYSTGSSIMPQKRNPDIAELVRGKTGRVYGNLLALLTTMKSLPLSYNRDMQEDKESLFDTRDTLLSCLEIFAGMIRTVKINIERLRQSAEEGYILATDIADYLVRKGVPFRQAHNLVGELVEYALAQEKKLDELKLEEYQRFSPLFDEDIRTITLESSIAARNIPGGTGQQEVKKQIERARRIIKDSP